MLELGELGDLHAIAPNLPSETGGAQCTVPEGGFYLFPDLSGLRDRLAARGVTLRLVRSLAPSKHFCEIFCTGEEEDQQSPPQDLAGDEEEEKADVT